MSVSLEQEITTNIMPEITPREPVSIDLAKTETAAIAPSKKMPSPVARNDNSLVTLILFVPIIFLLAIVALLLERIIKWGLRRVFSLTPVPKTTSAYKQLATLE